MPIKIEALEHEQERLNASVAAIGLLPSSLPKPLPKTLARLQTLQQELHTAYARWDELDSTAKG